MALITMDNVVKEYQLGSVKVHALNGLQLAIEEGEFVALMGSSGSGKSTAMHLIGSLDVATRGDICIKHMLLTSLSAQKLAQFRAKEVGFVFQTFHLIHSLTAVENVALPLIFQDIDESTRLQKARLLLEQVELGDRLHHLPGELSGGERQRVAIARSLVNDPSIILADEPTGNLDTRTGAAILELFKRIHGAGKTVIIITHDAAIANVADRIITLQDGVAV